MENAEVCGIKRRWLGLKVTVVSPLRLKLLIIPLVSTRLSLKYLILIHRKLKDFGLSTEFVRFQANFQVGKAIESWLDWCFPRGIN